MYKSFILLAVFVMVAAVHAQNMTTIDASNSGGKTLNYTGLSNTIILVNFATNTIVNIESGTNVWVNSHASSGLTINYNNCNGAGQVNLNAAANPSVTVKQSSSIAITFNQSTAIYGYVESTPTVTYYVTSTNGGYIHLENTTANSGVDLSYTANVVIDYTKASGGYLKINTAYNITTDMFLIGNLQLNIYNTNSSTLAMQNMSNCNMTLNIIRDSTITMGDSVVNYLNVTVAKNLNALINDQTDTLNIGLVGVFDSELKVTQLSQPVDVYLSCTNNTNVDYDTGLNVYITNVSSSCSDINFDVPTNWFTENSTVNAVTTAIASSDSTGDSTGASSTTTSTTTSGSSNDNSTTSATNSTSNLRATSEASYKMIGVASILLIVLFSLV